MISPIYIRVYLINYVDTEIDNLMASQKHRKYKNNHHNHSYLSIIFPGIYCSSWFKYLLGIVRLRHLLRIASYKGDNQGCSSNNNVPHTAATWTTTNNIVWKLLLFLQRATATAAAAVPQVATGIFVPTLLCSNIQTWPMMKWQWPVSDQTPILANMVADQQRSENLRKRHF